MKHEQGARLEGFFGVSRVRSTASVGSAHHLVAGLLRIYPTRE